MNWNFIFEFEQKLMTHHAFGCPCNKTFNIWTLDKHARKFVQHRLSMQWKRFRLCSAKRWNCFHICSATACYNFRKIPQKPQNNRNFDKCSNMKVWQKSKEKINFFSIIDQGHVNVSFRQKKFKNYLMLVWLPDNCENSLCDSDTK